MEQASPNGPASVVRQSTGERSESEREGPPRSGVGSRERTLTGALHALDFATPQRSKRWGMARAERRTYRQLELPGMPGFGE